MNTHEKDQLEARLQEAMTHLKYALEELKADRMENCETFLFMARHHAKQAWLGLNEEIARD